MVSGTIHTNKQKSWSLQMSKKSTMKDDIERAEKLLLVYSWAGVISALSLIGYSIWGIA
tara:strand:+ start:6361 stop:6537 length:177 start_codon:yes stop_codon:yes gene_type:complete